MLDIDWKTKLSLAYIPDLSKRECTEALRRINDNAAIVFLGTIKAEAARSGLQFRAWAAGPHDPVTAGSRSRARVNSPQRRNRVLRLA